MHALLCAGSRRTTANHKLEYARRLGPDAVAVALIHARAVEKRTECRLSEPVEDRTAAAEPFEDDAWLRSGRLRATAGNQFEAPRALSPDPAAVCRIDAGASEKTAEGRLP